MPRQTGTLNIEWNVYGKVSRVTRSTGTKDNLEFYYDAAGRRVMKIAKPRATAADRATWRYTVFSYDAGGQLMAEYDIEYNGASGGGYSLNNTGHYLYGASKLGRTRRRHAIKSGVSASYTPVESCASWVLELLRT